jgi:hypothetical protein
VCGGLPRARTVDCRDAEGDARSMRREPYRSASRVLWVVDNGSSHGGQAPVRRLRKRYRKALLVHTPVESRDRRDTGSRCDPAAHRCLRLTPPVSSSHQGSGFPTRPPTIILSSVSSPVTGRQTLAISDTVDGGGNCTRGAVSAKLCSACACVNSSEDTQEMCRDCETLQELVALWHGLTPEVREKVMGLARRD